MNTKNTKNEITINTANIKPQFEVLRNDTRLVTAPSYDKLHEALYQAEQLEETLVTVNFSMECYPLDGIVAVNKALEKVFGFTQAVGRDPWTPPTRLTIATGFGKEAQFAYGTIKPPMWEGGSIGFSIDHRNPMALKVGGTLKRKFEPSINEVVELSKSILKNDSIYRNSAVELDLSYIDQVKEGDGFDPDQARPRFIDTAPEVRLILPRDIEFELQNDIWDVIRHPEDFRANDIPIKHGVLLSGSYGTGKSLTAAKTAKIAAESGWTYFYLKTPDKFVEAYRIAQLYSPSVLFVEDVDAIFGGKRTAEMNTILETLDGMSSKKNEIITVFTSNFPEKINDAFIKRSGRVDNHIQLRPFDAEAAGRFINTFSGELLAADVDYNAVGESFAGLVPADLTEGVYKAKRRAIGKFGRDIAGKITTDMLVDAGHVMQKQRGVNNGDGLSEAERALETVRAAEIIKNPARGNGAVAVK